MTDRRRAPDQPVNILDMIEVKKKREKTPRAVTTDPSGANRYFRPLGYGRDRWFFLTVTGKQIIELTTSRLGKKTELLALAPLEWWEREFAGDSGFTGRSVDMATNYLIDRCRAAGVFSPNRRRGRGVWRDGDSIVIHAGDRLYVDGQPMELIEAQTHGVYEQQAAIAISVDDPLPAGEASKLLALGRLLNFEVSTHGRLWAGWVVVSMASGALRWRPHIAVIGPKGSGKTSVVSVTVGLLGDFCLSVTGGTTAAGLRQELAFDALPVVFDEAEGDSQRAAANMDDVLALMRHSSAGFDAKVLKGGSDGRANASTIQSCFCLAAIRDPLHQAADQTRVTVLEMRPPSRISGDVFRTQTEPLMAAVTEPDFVRRLHGRILANLPGLMKTVDVFRNAATAFFGDSRMGDQVGTMLAGAWMLEHDHVPSDGEAARDLDTLPWDEQETLIEEASDELACLDAILGAHIRVDGETWHGEAAVGELVRFIAERSSEDAAADARGMTSDKPKGPGGIWVAEAVRALALYGLRVEVDAERRPTGMLLVSNTNGMLGRKIMAHTSWPKGWGRLLARIPGACKPSKTVFIGGHGSRCTAVPIPDPGGGEGPPSR